MICKFFGGHAEGIEMDVDTSVRTYTLYHKGYTYAYDRRTWIEYSSGDPLQIKRTYSYSLRGED